MATNVKSNIRQAHDKMRWMWDEVITKEYMTCDLLMDFIEPTLRDVWLSDRYRLSIENDMDMAKGNDYG